MNRAKCPKCEESISNIHYEAHDPNSLSGYRGSQSFTAVAYPCGHALGAVPVTWELRLEEIDRTNREINQKLDQIYKEISQLTTLVREISSRK
ncbi:MAG: hypothetical protein HYT62_03940 [Candidatus Yanofskybacteria bacterium]|nr:hypothetical protein [Candidatus Yanofskybacteria bacterium]